MTKFLYRRVGSAFPYAVYKDAVLPFDPALGAGGLSIEVSGYNPKIVTTGPAGGGPVAAPAAKEMGRYHFTEDGGTAVSDQSSFATSGVVSGHQYYWNPTGLGFAGGSASTGKAQFASKSGMDTTQLRITLAYRGWSILSDTPSHGMIVGRDTRTGVRLWSLILLRDTRAIAFRGFNGGEVVISGDVDSLEQEVYHLYEIEVDGTAVRIWRDGVEIGFGALGGPLTSGTCDLTLGNHPDGSRSAPGELGFLRIDKALLSEGEIAYARQQALDVMAAKGVTLTTPAPAPPAKAPRFTARPTVSVATIYAGDTLEFSLGRAVSDPPPILTPNVTFGGVDVTPEGLTIVTTTPGRLNIDVTADNGIYDPAIKTVTVDVLRAYAELNDAGIRAALEWSPESMYRDDFEAGYPNKMTWYRKHLVDAYGDGTVLGLRIAREYNASRPYGGGSVQLTPMGEGQGSADGYRIGRYDGWFQLVPGVGGTVQTMFTFQHPYTLVQRECDFEFAGGASTENLLNPGSGRMDTAKHIGSSHRKLQHDVPPEAFTAFQKWSIVFNADRVEWLYNDQVISRYVQGAGFDESVQTLRPTVDDGGVAYDAAYVTANGKVILGGDANWRTDRMNLFFQQWQDDQNQGWIGANEVPVDPELFLVQRANGIEFAPSKVALQPADWGVTTTGITISALRPLASGFWPTSIEYSTDSGMSWTGLGAFTGLKTYAATIANGASVVIRAVAASPTGDYTLIGNPSDVKVVA